MSVYPINKITLGHLELSYSESEDAMLVALNSDHDHLLPNQIDELIDFLQDFKTFFKENPPKESVANINRKVFIEKISVDPYGRWKRENNKWIIVLKKGNPIPKSGDIIKVKSQNGNVTEVTVLYAKPPNRFGEIFITPALTRFVNYNNGIYYDEDPWWESQEDGLSFFG